MAMSMKELVELNEKNIRVALEDYGRYVESRKVLCDVSDIFIKRLAEDAVVRKHDLRELLSKSPAWNDELQAIVINGTRTHDPDYAGIFNLGMEILSASNTIGRKHAKYLVEFFADPKASPEKREEYIKAIACVAPDAYKPNKKKSRVFKAICDAVGVTDESAGSKFQRLFAQFADELSAKKLDFKLFLSINPAHFLTMSNPKEDSRGGMLTSCHSFNSTNYGYNNGCSGYARDDVTMIAFTVNDPSNFEELNNRKTSRQLFMYKVNNGVLLQSRMYNSSGGTCGVQKDSRLYRDLVQRELSALEDVPNLWKTYAYTSQDLCYICKDSRFGGYDDWNYKDFAARISIRADHKQDFRGFKVGASGLCIMCGDEHRDGHYCHSCSDKRRCEHCGCLVTADEIGTAYNAEGTEIRICDSCRTEHYFYCCDCDSYHPLSVRNVTAHGNYVCNNCFEGLYTQCSVCGEYYANDEITELNGIQICNGCLEET